MLTASLDEPRDAPQRLELWRDGRWLPAARRHRDLPVARPGGGRRARGSRPDRPQQQPPRHRPLPRRDVSGRHCRRAGRRRSTTTAGPSTRPRRSAPIASCWWSAGCPARRKDIAGARKQVQDGIAAVLPHARAANVPLAIEPLHPMYAADRACVNTHRPGARYLRGAGRGGRRRDRRLPRLVGPQPRRRHRAGRAARSASSRTTSATGWCRPPTCCSTAA